MVPVRRAAAAALLLFGPAMAAPPSPADALARAKQQLASNDCRAAIATLQSAMPQASAIADAKERSDARAALHFYTALAQSDCGRMDDARDQLHEFFRLAPGHHSLDRAKYKPAFFDLFTRVQRSLSGGGESFDHFYPGFDDAEIVSEERLPLDIWAISPAFLLLASDAEKEEWGRIREDAARQAFIDRFWQQRGPELRAAVARRIAFADRFFAVPEEPRGAMSDRGRVFVLLGPPARVYRKGLQRGETTLMSAPVRAPLTGNLERWIYFKPQLASNVAVQQVEFRFITQPGYGEYVMQRDFWPLKALGAARQTRP